MRKYVWWKAGLNFSLMKKLTWVWVVTNSCNQFYLQPHQCLNLCFMMTGHKFIYIYLSFSTMTKVYVRWALLSSMCAALRASLSAESGGKRGRDNQRVSLLMLCSERKTPQRQCLLDIYPFCKITNYYKNWKHKNTGRQCDTSAANSKVLGKIHLFNLETW